MDEKEIQERIEDLERLLRWCKMFIVESAGYSATREEEVAAIKEEMERLGI